MFKYYTANFEVHYNSSKIYKYLNPRRIIDHTKCQLTKIHLRCITLVDVVHADINLHLSIVTPVYLVPLVHELLHGDGTVGVDVAGLDAIALGDLLHLVLDPHDGLPLSVGLGEGSLELLVGCNEAL